MEPGKNYLFNKLRQCPGSGGSLKKKGDLWRYRYRKPEDQTQTLYAAFLFMPIWMYINHKFFQYDYCLQVKVTKTPETLVEFVHGDLRFPLEEGTNSLQFRLNFSPQKNPMDCRHEMKFVITPTSKNFVVDFEDLGLTVVDNENTHTENKQPMVMIFGGGEYMSRDISQIDTRNIMCFAHVYNYQLRRYLQEDWGYATLVCNPPKHGLDAPSVDLLPQLTHLIDISQRGLSTKEAYNPGYGALIRPKVSGFLCQICDNAKVLQGPQDVTFYAVPPKNKFPKSHWVGWAADTDLMKPEPCDKFRIIINQFANKPPGYDVDHIVVEVLRRFGNDPKYEIIRYGWNDHLVKYDDPHLGNYANYRVLKKKIFMSEKIKMQNQSKIFVQARMESLGISVIEAIASGNTIVTFNKFLKHNLYANQMVRAEVFPVGGTVDWDQVLARVNPAQSHEFAQRWNWQNLIARMEQFFNPPKLEE